MSKPSDTIIQTVVRDKGKRHISEALKMASPDPLMWIACMNVALDAVHAEFQDKIEELEKKITELEAIVK